MYLSIPLLYLNPILLLGPLGQHNPPDLGYNLSSISPRGSVDLNMSTRRLLGLDPLAISCVLGKDIPSRAELLFAKAFSKA